MTLLPDHAWMTFTFVVVVVVVVVAVAVACGLYLAHAESNVLQVSGIRS